MIYGQGNYCYAIGGIPVSTDADPVFYNLNFSGAEGISSKVSAEFDGSSIYTANPGQSTASASGIPSGSVITYTVDASAYTTSDAPGTTGLSATGIVSSATGDGSHVTYSGIATGNVSIGANSARAKVVSMGGRLSPSDVYYEASPGTASATAWSTPIALWPNSTVPDEYIMHRTWRPWEGFTIGTDVIMPYRIRGFELSGVITVSSYTSTNAYVSALPTFGTVSSTSIREGDGEWSAFFHNMYPDGSFDHSSWNTANATQYSGPFLSVDFTAQSKNASSPANVYANYENHGRWSATGIIP